MTAAMTTYVARSHINQPPAAAADDDAATDADARNLTSIPAGSECNLHPPLLSLHPLSTTPYSRLQVAILAFSEKHITFTSIIRCLYAT